MNWKRFLPWKRSEQRDVSGVASPQPWLVDLFGGGLSAAGLTITHESSLRATAVFAAVRVLSETVASLPLPIYRRDDGGKERAPEHPVYQLLHNQPNPEMTSFVWRELLQANLALWGNAFAFIERDQGNRPLSLWPLRADSTRAFRRAGRIQYETYGNDGKRYEIDPEDVLHVPALALGADGLNGVSPIAMARQAVGLSLAAETYGSSFFENGAAPKIAVEVPGRPDPDTFRIMRETWQREHSGPKKAGSIAFLPTGIKLHSYAIPPDDAQFLETRKFQVSEIARLYRIPPHMLGDLERSTNNNIEHQSIEFVVHTIRPWLVRWEMEINRKLFTPAERRRYFAEFLVDGLLRGDIASRYGAYAIGRQWGWLSANDIRSLENMNPIEGGDVYLSPLNMQGADATAEGAADAK